MSVEFVLNLLYNRVLWKTFFAKRCYFYRNIGNGFVFYRFSFSREWQNSLDLNCSDWNKCYLGILIVFAPLDKSGQNKANFRYRVKKEIYCVSREKKWNKRENFGLLMTVSQ